MTRPPLPRYFLWSIVAEGCTDRFCGRPFERNPYAPSTEARAWEYGWREADWYLEERAQQEARRWLGEAA